MSHLVRARLRLTSAQLFRDSFPQYESEKKARIFEFFQELLRSYGSDHIEICQWQLPPDAWRPLSSKTFGFSDFPGIYLEGTPFSYVGEPSKCNWWMNFGDSNLFHYYRTELFAQDEVQCLEIPELPTFLEYVMNSPSSFTLCTRDGFNPTPFAFYNVHRIISVDTSRIYGNVFAMTDYDVIMKSIKEVSLDDVRINIASMCALSGGSGRYSLDQIEYCVKAAYVTFAMCRHVSQSNGHTEVVINTGNWGCGAFGNDLQMMTLIQAFCATAAGVKLRFYTFDGASLATCSSAVNLFKCFLESKQQTSLQDAIQFLYDRNISWGIGNGT